MDAVAWLALALVGTAWLAAGLLWLVNRRSPGIATLEERTRSQLILAVLATLVALLAANRLNLLGFHLPNDIAVLILVVCLLAINVPGLSWLWLYARGDFAKPVPPEPGIGPDDQESAD